MELKILFENDEVVAIDKPAGLIVHSDGKTFDYSLADWIIEHYPQLKDIGESWKKEDSKEIPRPGIVHRLDRETSGVMLIAKTQESFESLKKQFQEHTIKKTYHAFLYGELKTKKGLIDRPIGRSSQDFRMWSAQRGARGEMRDAVTEYQTQKTGGGYTLVYAYPHTGRTHQIRVHFKAIHYPLVGDSLYAPGRENDLGFTRLALHSKRIEFKGLESSQMIVVEAPYPPDFEEALHRFEALLQS